MPPRSLSERSPVSVIRWGEDLCDEANGSSEFKTSSENTPLSKKVRFSKMNEVFPVEHLDDMPPEQVADIWYDPKEYSEIKSCYQVTIFMMESGQNFAEDDEEHTTRGLEYRTQTGAWARYENKRDAYNAVLDEQDRQWKEDCDDHDAISRVYLEHSTKCAEAAVKRAEEDAKIAREICASLYQLCKKKKKKSALKKSSMTDKDHVRKVAEERSSSRRDQVRSDLEQIQKSKKEKRAAV